jgi:predicted RNase H-like nuclease (RuvC/YqgF family)
MQQAHILILVFNADHFGRFNRLHCYCISAALSALLVCYECSVVIIVRFTITLPEAVASKLAADEERRKTPRSTLIAEYLKQHYADVEKPLVDYDAEIQVLKAEYAGLNGELKEANERNRSLTEQLQREKNSKDVVATGLQHEIELLQQKVTTLEATLHTERGHLSELRQDKNQLQKQLELVTLRLPAPKVGFWARIFGGRKKE